MTDHQRRIELQSQEDLIYLVDNVRRAANERIDKDLPPIEGEDHMRTRVEELVYAYVSKTFQSASENITINGLSPAASLLSTVFSPDAVPSATVIEEHEPFNAALFEHAKALARQEEELIEEIAALRRKMPKRAVEGAKKSYKEGMDGDEDILEKLTERATRDAEMDGDLDITDLERQQAVRETWARGLEGLERVKRTLPETVAKKERAIRAEEYVNGLEVRR